MSAVAMPRETDDTLANVSHDQANAQNDRASIAGQLKSVAQRLEAAERSQSETDSAMSDPATPEQSLAFEQSSAHAADQAERLTRLERLAAQDGTRDAVKVLHQGLSHLADQITQTANQSASQIATLAGALEQLANKLVVARNDSETAAHKYERRIAMLDERIHVIERTAYASASALDRALEDVDRIRAARDDGQVQAQRHNATMAELWQQLDRLNARIAASDAQNAGVQARFEETARRLEANAGDGVSDRRLQRIEHSLSDIANRLETTEHETAGASGNAEQALRDLAARFEAADRHNRDTIAELQVELADVCAKLAELEHRPSAAPPQGSISAETSVPETWALPRVPETATTTLPVPEATGPLTASSAEHETPATEEPSAAEPTPVISESADVAPATPDEALPVLPQMSDAVDTGPEPPPFDTQAVLQSEGSAIVPAIGAEAFAANAAQQAEAVGNESFLVAARRSAKAAAAQSQQAARAGAFSWSFPLRKEDTTRPKDRRTQYLFFGGAVVAVIVVAVAILMFSTRSVRPVSHTQAIAVTRPLAAKPATNRSRSAPATKHTVPSHPRAAAVTPAATVHAAAAAPASTGKLVVLANTGDAKSEMLLGLNYLDGKGVPVNEAEAARWLSRAAQQGEPVAQYRLATLYERGHGVPADPKQAAHWYELAAKQGNRKAMHNLAVAYAEGSGEPKDYQQAALWFGRAANLGLADSQFNLAVLCERGMGVKQSLTEAYKWYAIAAANGDAESKSRIEALNSQIGDADRTAAQAAASAFRPLAMNPAANSIPAPD